MVRIISIIYMTPTAQVTFSNFEEYRQFLADITPERYAYRLGRLAETMQLCEDGIVSTYFIPRAQVANVGYLFGSALEALRRLRDPEMRQLLFQPNNRITLQIRETATQYFCIATIHSAEEYRVITSTLPRRDAAITWGP